jgi:hypothetical protein
MRKLTFTLLVLLMTGASNQRAAGIRLEKKSDAPQKLIEQLQQLGTKTDSLKVVSKPILRNL